MEQLMACINRINGLKEFQNLSYKEKQKLIEEEIRIYVEEQKANAYNRAVKDCQKALNALRND